MEKVYLLWADGEDGDYLIDVFETAEAAMRPTARWRMLGTPKIRDGKKVVAEIYRDVDGLYVEEREVKK